MSVSNTETTSREIVNTRILNVSPEEVFKAWADPQHLARWWGPKSFTNTFQQFDMKPGGKWCFIMHGPDAADYQNESVFVEIERPRKIVLNHISAPKFRATVTYEDIGGKTKAIFRQLFETAAECDKIRKCAPEANEQNFDRLAAVLATKS
jgi:uncharacterized protein YndB with AHSA1/START domain